MIQIDNNNNISKMCNPIVILVGIEDYCDSTNPHGYNLDGVGVDIVRMINLWKNIYGYKDIHVVFKPLKINKNNNNKNKNRNIIKHFTHNANVWMVNNNFLIG